MSGQFRNKLQFFQEAAQSQQQQQQQNGTPPPPSPRVYSSRPVSVSVAVASTSYPSRQPTPSTASPSSTRSDDSDKSSESDLKDGKEGKDAKDAKDAKDDGEGGRIDRPRRHSAPHVKMENLLTFWKSQEKAQPAVRAAIRPRERVSTVVVAPAGHPTHTQSVDLRPRPVTITDRLQIDRERDEQNERKLKATADADAERKAAADAAERKRKEEAELRRKEEEKKKEEDRKKEEERRREEERKKKEHDERVQREHDERVRKEEERKKKEEAERAAREAKRKQEEEARQREEAEWKRKEEDRIRKHDEDERKRKEEEAARLAEIAKIEDAEKRRIEEEHNRARQQEEDRRREALEAAERAEHDRIEAERIERLRREEEQRALAKEQEEREAREAREREEKEEREQREKEANAASTPSNSGEAKKLKDDRHPHELTYYSQLFAGVYFCAGCMGMQSTPAFHCTQCGDYQLCEACATANKQLSAEDRALLAQGVRFRGAPSDVSSPVDSVDEAGPSPSPTNASSPPPSSSPPPAPASPSSGEPELLRSGSSLETRSHSPSSPTGETDEQKRERKAAKDIEMRQKVRDEIVSTEKTYVDSLLLLINKFIYPLKGAGASTQYNISQQKVSLIFGNIELLANFHQVFLADLSAPNKPDVSSVILKYAPYFKMYSQYLNGYGTSMQALDENRNNAKFQAFLESVRLQVGMGLMSYLIMPVQRIPRYELLLRELMRFTPTTHPEYPGLEQAFATVKNVANHMNETKRQVENMAKLMEVQNKISGDFGSLMQPHRHLIREGKLTKLSNGVLSTTHSRQVFLFNDIFLWTTPAFKYCGHMELATADVSIYLGENEKKKLSSSSKTSGKTFAVHGGVQGGNDKTLVFICTTDTERDDWFKDVQGAIGSVHESIESARKRRREQRVQKGTQKGALFRDRGKRTMTTADQTEDVSTSGTGMHMKIAQSLQQLSNNPLSGAADDDDAFADGGGGGAGGEGPPEEGRERRNSL